jgi:hypothetical protein
MKTSMNRGSLHRARPVRSQKVQERKRPAALGPALLTLILVFGSSLANAANVLTADDYARAERFTRYNTDPLVLHSVERPVWLPSGKLAYRTSSADGNEFVLLDPLSGARAPLFDKAWLAAALSAAAGEKYDPERLPFGTFEFSEDAQSIHFEIDSKHWSCDVQGNR